MISGLNFVALDFETANRKRGSICAVGLVRVRDGIIVKSRSWLMRPPAGVGGGIFEPVCVDVHGITPYMVAGQPTFAQRYPALIVGLADDLLVAHNAAFDRSVLNGACKAEGLPSPGNQWLCTVEESRRVLAGSGLANHKLPTVAAALGVDQIHHHDAGDDALVAARVHIELVRLTLGVPAG